MNENPFSSSATTGTYHLAPHHGCIRRGLLGFALGRGRRRGGVIKRMGLGVMNQKNEKKMNTTDMFHMCPVHK